MVESRRTDSWENVQYQLDPGLEVRVKSSIGPTDTNIDKAMLTGLRARHTWKVIQERKKLGETALANEDIARHSQPVTELASMVDLEKETYGTTGPTRVLRLRAELISVLKTEALIEGFADEQGRTDISPIMREAALFFCNAQEIFNQGWKHD
jgi:hypothetical protein